MLRYFYDDITLRISVCGVTVRSVRHGNTRILCQDILRSLNHSNKYVKRSDIVTIEGNVFHTLSAQKFHLFALILREKCDDQYHIS